MIDAPRLDGRTLLVLASHPLRTRLLGQLRIAGPATATALARELDTNTGATSYHLRKLEEVGLVTDTREGKGRERWWRATHEMHEWHVSDLVGEEEGEAALTLLHAEHWRRFTELAERWMAHESAWPTQWRDLAGAGDYLLQLSPTSMAALQAEVDEVIGRYHARGPEEGAERLNLFLHWLPEADPQ